MPRASLISLSHIAAAPSALLQMRAFALEFATQVQPGISRPELQHIADALNGASEALCRNVTLPPADSAAAADRRPPEAAAAAAPAADAIVVAATGTGGSDANPGTVALPKATIQAAVLAARGTVSRTVLLRGGVHMEGSSVRIEASDSGLTVTSFPGELAEVSGAVSLVTDWKPIGQPSPRESVPATALATAGDTDAATACSMVEDPLGSIRSGPVP